MEAKEPLIVRTVNAAYIFKLLININGEKKKLMLDKLNAAHCHIYGAVTPHASDALYTIMKLMIFDMEFSVLRTKLVKFNMMDMDAMGH